MGAKEDIVRQNAKFDPDYCPYCLRCTSFVRMRLVARFVWSCPCGALHDARTDEERAAVMVPSTQDKVRISSMAQAPERAIGWAHQVLSILDPGIRAPAFGPGIEHLTLHFDDVEEGDILEGDVAATSRDIERGLAFVRNDTNVLVHCFAGVCRSTAFALGVMIQRGMTVKEAYAHLEDIRPQAWPNSLVLSHIDKHLGLNGKLVDFNVTWRLDQCEKIREEG